MSKEPLIAGLPAREFIQCQVKTRCGDRGPLSVCIVTGVTSKGKIELRVANSSERWVVEPKAIIPYWSRTPHLKAKYDILKGQLVEGIIEQPIPARIAIAPLDEDGKKVSAIISNISSVLPPQTQIPETPVTPTVPSPSIPPKPQSVVGRKIKNFSAPGNIGTAWLQPFQDLQRLNEGIASKQAALRKLQEQIAEEIGLIELYASDLEAAGITIEWE